MDLDFTFWLAIAAIYVLQFFLGKKKNREANADSSTPSVDSDGKEKPDSFGDALAEISRMLSGEAPKEQRSEPRQIERPQLPPQMDPAVIHTKRSVLGAPSYHMSPAPGTSLSTKKPAFYDEPFEKTDYVDFHAPVITHPKPIKRQPIPVISALQPVEEAQSVRPVSRSLSSEVNRDIHNLAKAQEALVLAEVLGPPVSKKPPGRRR